jgi:guanylate kinase
MEHHLSGQIFVITGPSGVGKGTLCSRLLQVEPAFMLSVSATSRAPRAGEVDGVSYHFYTADAFAEMVAHDEHESDVKRHLLLEWASYNGNYYGTPRQTVQAALQQGRHVILEIETQGALQVRERFPSAHLVFIAPPDLETLARRLRGRGTENESDIANRLHLAKEELNLQDRFDIVLVNDDLEVCLDKLRATLKQFLNSNSLSS